MRLPQKQRKSLVHRRHRLDHLRGRFQGRGIRVAGGADLRRRRFNRGPHRTARLDRSELFRSRWEALPVTQRLDLVVQLRWRQGMIARVTDVWRHSRAWLRRQHRKHLLLLLCLCIFRDKGRDQRIVVCFLLAVYQGRLCVDYLFLLRRRFQLLLIRAYRSL